MLVSRSARADDPDGARRDFAEGVRLLQLGDFEGARRLFKKADAEHHAPAIIYNLGLVEERLGHSQAAVDAYEAYVTEAGDSGELSSAAAFAIAQVKARSTRLRIGTTPSGARVFVNGATLPEASPTSWLVPAGHHVVIAQGTGWRGEQDVEARGAGDVIEVVVNAPPAEVAPAVPAVPSLTEGIVEHAATPMDRPNGLVWGAAFALVPFTLLGSPNKDKGNGEGATQLAAGAVLELGYAITDRFELLVRGLFALGPDGKPTTASMGGPGISLRVGSRGWLGASFIGGQLSTEARSARFQTDLVFGTLLEATYAVIVTREGQWTVGVQPGLLLTTEAYDNTAILFPLSFGYRAY